MIISACPDGWEWKPEFSTCYYLGTNLVTWTEANELCMALDPEATLTSIHSQAENDYVSSLRGDGRAWLGGTKDEEGTWRWVNISELTTHPSLF